MIPSNIVFAIFFSMPQKLLTRGLSLARLRDFVVAPGEGFRSLYAVQLIKPAAQPRPSALKSEPEALPEVRFS